MFGPLVNGPRGNEMRNVQISDPTTGTMVMLDLQSRTAHRMPAPPRLMLRNKIAGVNGNAASMSTNSTSRNLKWPCPLRRRRTPGASGGVMFNRVEAIAGMPAEKPVVESLGTQFMEGIAVEGTRTTLTIPAGQIGNELPIHDRVGALVFARPESAGDEPSIRPALRRDHLSAYEHHARRAVAAAVRNTGRLHDRRSRRANREMVIERKIVK